ncbi:MAG: hypothetical protein ACYC61_11655 [Isosphaeraceae bacterium]
MPRVVGRVDDIDDSIEFSIDRAGAWGRLRIPRPSAIVAACLVAITLSRIPLLDPDFTDSLALRYGWPLSVRLRLDVMLHHSATPSPTLAFAAMAFDVASVIALVLATLVATHIGACLLNRKPRRTVASLCILVAAAAAILALCRLSQSITNSVMFCAFFYGVASLVTLTGMVLFRLELPRAEEPGPDPPG